MRGALLLAAGPPAAAAVAPTLALVAALSYGAAASLGAAAQEGGEGPPVAVARVAPDTARVGEPFLVGVAVRGGRGARIDFPAASICFQRRS